MDYPGGPPQHKIVFYAVNDGDLFYFGQIKKFHYYFVDLDHFLVSNQFFVLVRRFSAW